MTRQHFFATAAILLSLATPALAGEADRARAAIAEARGKIEAGDKVGASSGAPMLQTDARKALGDAELLLARGKKTESLAAARRAGELADIAIVNADRDKMAASRDRRIDAEAAASSAQAAVVNAQASATAAEARANAAERAADSANARADAMAAMPMAAPTTTVDIVEKTVTPVRTKRVAPRKKVAVRHHRQTTPATSKETTTTVTTGPN